MASAFIALGSNLQAPLVQVSRAITVIANTPKVQVRHVSSLYETTPVGYDDQPNFINAVVAVDTQFTAQDLMQWLLNTEQQFGRERPFANAPRVLDLDLLVYDDVHMQTEFLTLPHPRMHERGFVMLPLAEIAPHFVLPQAICQGRTAVEWAHQFQSDAVQRHPFSSECLHV